MATTSHGLREKVDITVEYADRTGAAHVRTDSPTYLASRKWMIGSVEGGCFVCGGAPDMGHPGTPGSGKGMEDHHGNPLYIHRRDGTATLVGMGLIPTEWAGGWGTDPKVVQAFVTLHRETEKLLAPGVDLGPDPVINTVDDVMQWVDSKANASLKLCHSHHVGLPTQHTPDANGHEALGIHHTPLPIWALQVTHDWNAFDLFAGTTGTIAVAAPRQDGSTVVLHADPAKHRKLAAAVAAGPVVLPANHRVARAARRTPRAA